MSEQIKSELRPQVSKIPPASQREHRRAGDSRDGTIRAPRLPGGGLIEAVLDRTVMGLADKGGASGLVGARWADLCAEHVAGWHGRTLSVPANLNRAAPFEAHRVDRVVRLDDTPAIAATAASQALQNPDFFIIGEHDGRHTLQAADAKFSVETARAKQVSSEVLSGLLTLGPLIEDLLGDLHEPLLVDGLFICPDFPLTHLMLRKRHGIVRSTVRADQVEMFPASGAEFFAPVAGASIMAPLAAIDRLPVSIDDSLLAALYYFRLARAAGGCWMDATGPLLTYADTRLMDEEAVREHVVARSVGARSAWELIQNWDLEVQSVRNQRIQVEQVAGLPIINRELRELINRLAVNNGGEAPSMNKVRRRIGSWYRAKLRAEFGPIQPPVTNLTPLLRDISRYSASLNGALRQETVRIITELLTDPNGRSESVAVTGEVVS